MEGSRVTWAHRPDRLPPGIVVNDPDFGYAIGAECGIVYNPAVDPVIARMRGDELLGGFVFNGFTGHSIAMHMAGFAPGWASKTLVRFAFGYAFLQLGCEKVFGLVPSTNEAALDIDRRVGFREITRIEGVFADGDLVVLEMRRSECRWLEV